MMNSKTILLKSKNHYLNKVVIFCVRFGILFTLAYLIYSRVYQPSIIDNLESKYTDSINSKELAHLLKYDNSQVILFDFRSVEDYNKGHMLVSIKKFTTVLTKFFTTPRQCFSYS